MRIVEIFGKRSEEPSFNRYLTNFQPPLSVAQLSLKRAVVGKDSIPVPLDKGVVGVLQLMYKDRAGGTLGLAEDSGGEV